MTQDKSTKIYERDFTSVKDVALSGMDIAQHTIEEKNGVCYGASLNDNLSVVYAGWKKASKGYCFRYTNFPFYRLVYTMSGTLTVNDYKQTHYNAEAGTVVSFAPGEEFELANNSDIPWTHLYIHFTGLEAAKMYNATELTSQQAAILHEPLEIQQLFENIVRTSIGQGEHSQIICNLYLQVLLLSLSDLDLGYRSHSGASKITYLQCLNYINENFSSIVGIEQVAQEFCIDKNHLCRLFKKYASTSPLAYIIQLKMNKAAVLLVETDLPIKEISFMMGFSDPYYFSKVFRKICGVPPIVYRGHRTSRLLNV